jgi:hypothetical protein
LRRLDRVEQVAPVGDRKVPQLAEGAPFRLAMAAPDNGRRGRELSVIHDHADTIALGTNKLKSHRQSNWRYSINKKISKSRAGRQPR